LFVPIVVKISTARTAAANAMPRMTAGFFTG
jgi:hypothetical protein